MERACGSSLFDMDLPQSVSVEASLFILEEVRCELQREEPADHQEEERSGWAHVGHGPSSWSTVEILGDETGYAVGGIEV